MKVKEYVDLFKLKESKHFDRNVFVEYLESDFLKSLNQTQMSPVIFTNKVSELKTKFDNIFNKCPVKTEETEKFWKYIYATKIIPVRSKLFPGDWKDVLHVYKMKTNPTYRQKYENWKFHKDQEEWFTKSFYEHFEQRLDLLNQLLMHGNSDRVLLEIPITKSLTENVIKSHYNELVKIHHPDKGGDNEYFIKITDAKNRLIASVGE
jgi:hypothetical protein